MKQLFCTARLTPLFVSACLVAACGDTESSTVDAGPSVEPRPPVADGGPADGGPLPADAAPTVDAAPALEALPAPEKVTAMPGEVKADIALLAGSGQYKNEDGQGAAASFEATVPASLTSVEGMRG